jgi:hypothetical protein
MGPHGIDGWYVGPSIDHYRCHKCYIPSTFGVRDALTIDWFPHNVPFPKVTADEYLRQTANDMLMLIQEKTTHPIPSLTYGSNITNAYIQIAQILKQATAPPGAVPTPDPASEPRVPLITPPAPEQRVLVPAPALPVSTKPHQPATKQHPPMIRPTARFPTPRLARRNPVYPHRHTHTHHQPLAQSATNEQYAHHITALTTAPPMAGKQGSLTNLLLGPDATIWERSLVNEWGRLLAHGFGNSRPAAEQVKGTGTVFFIEKTQVPKDHRVTYANFLCNIRPQKTETHRVRMTAGIDKLDHPGDASSPAVSMLDAKLHINSTISDAKNGARYLGLDIKNFYLSTPMSYFQYIRVRPSIIPKEVWDNHRYTIPIASEGYIYLEIRRSMYGLKEAGILAFNQLVQKLKPAGYEPMPFTRPLAPSHEAHRLRSLHRQLRHEIFLQNRRHASH